MRRILLACVALIALSLSLSADAAWKKVAPKPTSSPVEDAFTSE